MTQLAPLLKADSSFTVSCDCAGRRVLHGYAVLLEERTGEEDFLLDSIDGTVVVLHEVAEREGVAVVGVGNLERDAVEAVGLFIYVLGLAGGLLEYGVERGTVAAVVLDGIDKLWSSVRR